MKERLKNSPRLRSWFYTQSPLVITRPALRETAACAGTMFGGFLLSCGKPGGMAAPLALSFLASVGGGLRGLTCLIGLGAGYLTMQSFAEGLQMASSGVLIYVCSYIFAPLWVARRSWFRCAAAGTMTAVVGLIFLLSQQFTPALLVRYAALVLCAGLLPLSYDRLLSGRRQSAAALLALVSFLTGLSALPTIRGINLGCVAGVTLTSLAVRRSEPPAGTALAAGCGLALDVSLGSVCWTVALTFGALVGAGAGKRLRHLRVPMFVLAAGGALAYLEILDGGRILDLAIGAAAGLILPAGWIGSRERDALQQSVDTLEERLLCGRDVFFRIHEMVSSPAKPGDPNRIFDRAAAKVCRRCSRFSRCWEDDLEQTVQALSAALPGILERGEAGRQDFPEPFLAECCQSDGLIEAVNRELERMAGEARARSRRMEEQAVVGRMMLQLGRMLEGNARALRTDPFPVREAYRAKLGVAARSRGGARISGDRGASLHTDRGRLYVILCDGAGTGSPAAAESRMAVDTLTELIRAGMPPDAAMETLNGTFVLRDNGSFSTMDILEVNLISGQGVLYKWGAAPSYLRSGGGVLRLGHAAPPPGLGVETQPEILRLSLWNGDVLALTSDGLDSEETERLLEEFPGDNVKAIARALVEHAAEQGGEDDMTAAVVRIIKAKD